MRRSDTGLLHPVALSALALLVINDHVLKPRFHNVVTGKLSDIAGLVIFPLFLSALLRRRYLGACIAVTMIGFALVKTWPPMTELCATVLGWLPGGPAVVVRDPTDLVALPFALVGARLRSTTGS